MGLHEDCWETNHMYIMEVFNETCNYITIHLGVSENGVYPQLWTF